MFLSQTEVVSAGEGINAFVTVGRVCFPVSFNVNCLMAGSEKVFLTDSFIRDLSNLIVSCCVPGVGIIISSVNSKHKSNDNYTR